MMPSSAELSQREYELFRKLVYAESGINLGDKKMQLVKSRLGKLVREGEFDSYRDYYEHIVADESGEALSTLLDAISTNTTHLFREDSHFDVLTDIIDQCAHDPDWRKRSGGVLRIWSSACSSGEEPHTIAMVADAATSAHQRMDFKLLATDISIRMLARARQAVYPADKLGQVPAKYRAKCFVAAHGAKGMKQLAPDLLGRIRFARLNLMSERFPFRHGFDVIFCRNVMIYFDKPTQQTLVQKFTDHLHPGGTLIIGHSESLSGIDHGLDLVQTTVYTKPVEDNQPQTKTARRAGAALTAVGRGSH